MMWHAAYWGVPVAEKMGMLLSFLEGKREVCAVVAANIELVAGLLRREQEQHAHTLSLELAKWL